jgi:hypothetical protein
MNHRRLVLRTEQCPGANEDPLTPLLTTIQAPALRVAPMDMPRACRGSAPEPSEVGHRRMEVPSVSRLGGADMLAVGMRKPREACGRSRLLAGELLGAVWLTHRWIL